MIKLSDVTLLAVSSIKIPQTLEALKKCYEKIEFAENKIITHEKPKDLSEDVIFEECPQLKNIDDYNYYIFKELWKHVNTSHCLIVQYDSWIIRDWLWNDEWLIWDYGGSIWPIRENAYWANDGTRSRVGNGGFSLRSRRLLSIPQEKSWELRREQGYASEDGQFCCYYKKELLAEGIKYMPIDEAAKFAFETLVSENLNVPAFGFHKNLQLMQGETIEQFI